MGQGEPQIFSSITPGHYTKLVEKANAAGIDLSGNTGKASKFGVEVAWNYAPETQQLTLQCLKTPFFVKTEEVNSKLRELVQNCAG